MDKEQFKGYTAAFITTIIFGFTFLFSKNALVATNSRGFNILSYRFLVSAICGIILIQLKVLNVDYKKIFSISAIPLLLLSTFNPILSYTLETIGVNYVSTSELSIYVAVVPALTAMIAYIFIKEKLKPLEWLFIFISIFGIAFISYFGNDGVKSENFGRLAMFLSVTCNACFFVLSKKTSNNFTALERTMAMQINGAIAFTIIALLVNINNNTLDLYFSDFFKPDVLMNSLYCGIAASLICMLLLNYSITKVNASRISFVSNFTVIVSMIVGVVFLNEVLYWYHFVGILLIGCSIIGSTLYTVKKDA